MCGPAPIAPTDTEFEPGDAQEIRGAARIFVDTGPDVGHWDTITSAIAAALPSISIVPLFAADLVLYYRGAPSNGPASKSPVIDRATPVGFGWVSRPVRDWRGARVLLMVDSTAGRSCARRSVGFPTATR